MIAGIEPVINALSRNDADEWEMLSFFLSPNALTADTAPIDLLDNCNPENLDSVVRAARLHGIQGAV